MRTPEEIGKESPAVPGSLDDDTARLIATTLNLSTEGEVKIIAYPHTAPYTIQLKINRQTAGPYDLIPSREDIAPNEHDASLYRNARRWLLLLLAERAQLLRLLVDDRLADMVAREMGRREGREAAARMLEDGGYHHTAAVVREGNPK